MSKIFYNRLTNYIYLYSVRVIEVALLQYQALQKSCYSSYSLNLSVIMNYNFHLCTHNKLHAITSLHAIMIVF